MLSRDYCKSTSSHLTCGLSAKQERAYKKCGQLNFLRINGMLHTMFFINIKALSLNNAYRGRRFATKELQDYKRMVAYLAPSIVIPDGKLKVKYIFGVSTKNSDGDNLIKCCQDALAEKYRFNDKKIYKWEVEKVDVKKGFEFISFDISAL